MPSSALVSWFFFSGSSGNAAQAVQPLHVDGRHFKTPDGQIVKLLSISAFRAYQRFLQGRLDELGAYLSWWAGLGGNCIRVFFTHGAPDNDKFLPWDWPNYYDQLPAFFAYVEGFGLRVHATCFTGQVEGWPEYMAPDKREQHVRSISRAAGQSHLVEGINENFKNGQIDIPADWFGASLWTLSCWVWTEPAPQGKWAHFHRERKEATQIVRKGHDVIEIPFSGPRGEGESGQTPRDIPTPQQNRTSVMLLEALGDLETIHGSWDDLQQCRVPTGLTLECIQAACDGWHSGLVPPEASSWSYRRDEAAAIVFMLGGPSVPENPSYGCQHVYSSNDGSREIAIIVEPTADFRHEPKGGWRSVKDDPSAVYLERT